MILAVVFSLLVASAGHASQEALTISPFKIHYKNTNEPVARFTESLRKLIKLLKNHTPTVSHTLTEQACPHRDVKASQVFSAASTLAQQVGECLPPGQRQILGLFSLVTSFAADALRDDEDYQDFKQYQAARAAQRKSLSFPQEPSEFLIVSPEQLEDENLNTDNLLLVAPDVACKLLNQALETVTFLDNTALQAARNMLCENDRYEALTHALAETSFSLHFLAGIHALPFEETQTLSELFVAPSIEEHKKIIAMNTALKMADSTFLTNLFSHINTATKTLIQQTLQEIIANLEC